ncbi:MAG: Gfo/Idh/MocA family oxidoreductase [bacterium]|nr:Gfo/Idh/MocA family oxidoreductase [bacterium]
MRFLIVGLGSMGKRRIRNLLVHGEKDIVGFDVRPDRNEETKAKYGIKIINNFKDISPDDFDVMIISASPDAHGDYIRFAIQHKKHFFVEHPTNDNGYQDILENKDLGIVMAPSCTFRFYEPVKMIKNILESGRIGKILAFQYHMGQYLPDWHPWEDYRQVYFSKKETSACREMVAFELIWLNWLINSKVAEASGIITKVSDLDMDADDLVLARLKYESGTLGNMLVDVISRKPYRTLRILGSDGVLDWERFDSTIKVYDISSKTTEVIPVPQGRPEPGYVNEEEMYNDEIKAFLDAIAGKATYPFSFAENLLNLKTLFKIIRP